jgi:hypothetical protein
VRGRVFPYPRRAAVAFGLGGVAVSLGGLSPLLSHLSQGSRDSVSAIGRDTGTDSSSSSPSLEIPPEAPPPDPIALTGTTTTSRPSAPAAAVSTTTTTSSAAPVRASGSPSAGCRQDGCPVGKAALLDPSAGRPYPDGCAGRGNRDKPMTTAEAHRCWDGLLGQYTWKGGVAKAFSVMMCESGGRSAVLGPPSSSGTPTGLMQIKRGPTDPVANIRLAAEMHRSRGWQPWACA